MIITLDGNVFTGKTSLIEKFRQMEQCSVIPEHGHFLADIISGEDAWDMQRKYLGAERRRHEYLSTLSFETLIILDRSFVSMAAHVVALNALRSIDIRSRFLSELIHDIQSGEVIIPDKFLFVRCGYGTIKARALKDIVKNTDPLYYDQEYLEVVDNFNRQWQGRFPGVVIDTDVDQSVQLGQLALIKEWGVSRSSGYAVDDICRHLAKLLA